VSTFEWPQRVIGGAYRDLPSVSLDTQINFDWLHRWLNGITVPFPGNIIAQAGKDGQTTIGAIGPNGEAGVAFGLGDLLLYAGDDGSLYTNSGLVYTPDTLRPAMIAKPHTMGIFVDFRGGVKDVPVQAGDLPSPGWIDSVIGATTAGSTIVYDNTVLLAPMPNAIRLTTTGSIAQRLSFGVRSYGKQLYHCERWYIYMDTLNSVNIRMGAWTLNGNEKYYLMLNGPSGGARANKIDWLNGPGTAQGAGGQVALQAATWYRIETEVDHVAQTAKFSLFLEHSTIPLETFTASFDVGLFGDGFKFGNWNAANLGGNIIRYAGVAACCLSPVGPYVAYEADTIALTTPDGTRTNFELTTSGELIVRATKDIGTDLGPTPHYRSPPGTPLVRISEYGITVGENKLMGNPATYDNSALPDVFLRTASGRIAGTSFGSKSQGDPSDITLTRYEGWAWDTGTGCTTTAGGGMTFSDWTYGGDLLPIFMEITGQSLHVGKQTGATTTSGSPNVAISNGNFTAAHVGQTIFFNNVLNAAYTISAVTDATHIVLASNFGSTLSNVAWEIGYNVRAVLGPTSLLTDPLPGSNQSGMFWRCNHYPSPPKIWGLRATVAVGQVRTAAYTWPPAVRPAGNNANSGATWSGSSATGTITGFAGTSLDVGRVLCFNNDPSLGMYEIKSVGVPTADSVELQAIGTGFPAYPTTALSNAPWSLSASEYDGGGISPGLNEATLNLQLTTDARNFRHTVTGATMHVGGMDAEFALLDGNYFSGVGNNLDTVRMRVKGTGRIEIPYGPLVQGTDAGTNRRFKVSTGATLFEMVMGRADAPTLVPDFRFSSDDWQLYTRALIVGDVNDAANINIRRTGGTTYNGALTGLGDGVVPGYLAWNSYDGTSFNLPNSNARMASISARTKGLQSQTNRGGDLLFNTQRTNTLATTATGVNALNSATVNVGSTAGFPVSGTFYLNNNPVTYTGGGGGGTQFTGCGNHAATVGGEPVVPFDLDAIERMKLADSGKLTVWAPTDTLDTPTAAKDSIKIGNALGGGPVTGVGMTIGSGTLFWDGTGLASDHRLAPASLQSVGGIVTKVKAGIPVDSDFVAGIQQSGLIAVDTTNNRLYVRVGTTWKYAALT
jgi:hypothetical protein